MTSGGNLWRLKETGCMGILQFGPNIALKRRKSRVSLTVPLKPIDLDPPLGEL
jgi:hypothetical protein